MVAACGGTQAGHTAPTSAGIVLLSLKDGTRRGAASIGSDVAAVAVSTDGSTAYIADRSPGDVYSVGVADLHVRWKRHLGGAPFGLLFSAGRLYVSLFDTTSVVELDPADGRTLAGHTVPQGPAAMAVDAAGRVIVAGTRGNVAWLGGATVPGGHGFTVAVVNGQIWTSEYERAELWRAGDDHIVGMPLPLFPYWLSPASGDKLFITAESGIQLTDAGAAFEFDPATETFKTLARAHDPDQILQSGAMVYVAAHGDRDVLAINGGTTTAWAQGVPAMALAADPSLGILVVGVNARE